MSAGRGSANYVEISARSPNEESDPETIGVRSNSHGNVRDLFAMASSEAGAHP